jgi:phosphopantetheinyl transferase (holo-ACP synthase)
MQQTQIGIDIIEISRVKEDLTMGRKIPSTDLYRCRAGAYRGKEESSGSPFRWQGSCYQSAQHTDRIGWRDIEILSETSGKPVVHLMVGTETSPRVGIGGVESAFPTQGICVVVIGQRRTNGTARASLITKYLIQVF